MADSGQKRGKGRGKGGGKKSNSNKSSPNKSSPAKTDKSSPDKTDKSSPAQTDKSSPAAKTDKSSPAQKSSPSRSSPNRKVKGKSRRGSAKIRAYSQEPNEESAAAKRITLHDDSDSGHSDASCGMNFPSVLPASVDETKEQLIARIADLETRVQQADMERFKAEAEFRENQHASAAQPNASPSNAHLESELNATKEELQDANERAEILLDTQKSLKAEIVKLKASEASVQKESSKNILKDGSDDGWGDGSGSGSRSKFYEIVY